MSGQVIPKGEGKWLVRWYVGRDAAGKRVYNSETVHGTHAIAQRTLRGKLVAKDQGTLVATTKQTLCAYLTGLPTTKDVLETLKAKKSLQGWVGNKKKISAKTRHDYQQRIVQDILPTLGHLPLAKVSSSHCEALVAAMETKDHSPRTMQYTLSVLKQALGHAVRDRLIGHNPAEFIETPTVVKAPKVTLPTDRIRVLLESPTLPIERKARWAVAFSTGMRPQEYLALSWDDALLTDHAIIVRRALVEVTPGHWIIGPTKTKESHRTIPVPPAVIELLKEHRKIQREAILKQGAAYTRNNLIFAGPTGWPWDLSAVRRQFKADCKAHQLPVVKLYATRHSHATALLGANVHPKVMQERLGHSTIRHTMDSYTDVLPSMQQEASNAVGSLLFDDQQSTVLDDRRSATEAGRP